LSGSAGGVVLELPDLLWAAAGNRDLRGPLEGRFPRGQLKNGVPTVGDLASWVGTLRKRAVTGHKDRLYRLIYSATEDIYACRLGILDDGMRGLDYRLEFPAGITMASLGNEIRYFVTQ
jgi:hypothetical protein